MRFITGGKELATLWGVAQRVREITADQHASLKELVKVIGADPVLTSKVLRLVNSAAYGFRGRIANIDQAIVILGFRQLRDLCITLTIVKGVGIENRCESFDRISLWKHSLGTAVASKFIQERYAGSQSADLFVAGLLCNIGRLILDQHFPKEFTEILKLAKEKNLRLIDAERRVLDVTHADIGYWAATAWYLDDTLAGTIRDHHGPSGNKNADIVNLAYVLTQIKGIGSPGDPMLTMLIPGVLESLKLDQERLEIILRDLDEEFGMVEPLLKIMTE
jgi:HD-like signal output (HDOD) protein